ncbi:disintegrin and metalloproteinase domain-containing protein 2-like isoform X3 [Rhineura floridana]|uniref:disintegrin and metalloproteinase domain-containing protein 2-like isoform X3 n=1 Tax=Rhineura floridana TaxID=261503 RepID=UPI002AC85407|nr:disintegrin and metalloproteinase domain-containing protein 2-like isoform X3 [Rhineura floridana]
MLVGTARKEAMALLRLVLTLLPVCLVSALGSRRTFLQVTVPQRIPPHSSGNTERMTFDIDINGNPYTIHLKQQSFLSNDFRVYTYTHGGSVVSFVPSIQRDCYYQGYVEGYTDSVVMLSTCAGLNGLLQFENASYGIEPVESASGFQHLIYQTEYKDAEWPLSQENYSIRWTPGIAPRIDSGLPVNFSTVRYVEMHTVVAKALYDYMGSDEDTVMRKITQLVSFINTMFYKLNMRILLSSMEFWKDKDKISTAGTAKELLERFVDWKQVHLTLRPHDVAFLFVFRNKGDSVGSTFARKMCSRPSSAGIAVYEKGITLEAFSVIVAQLLGFSLGLYFDNSRQCHCPGTTCLMNTNAVQASGIKSFSSCSIKDFQNFLGSGVSQCLLNKPRMDITYRAPFCGNREVEDGEQCDCGTARECESNPCCASDCTLKRGKACAHGSCCWHRYCTLKAKGTLCRSTSDDDCDLKEYCNGTSTECTEDFHVQDGQLCEGDTGVCMKGICQSPDRWCRKMFGKDSKSGSSQCYEEINSQRDRMGHCGSSTRGYDNCQWQDLKCGKLVCEYPSKKPFIIENAAIIYARVQNRLCVTLDYMKGPGVKDPFLVRDGTGCGENKVCNNKGNCHCNEGWAPPDCTTEEKGGLGGSIDSTFRSASVVGESRSVPITTRNWLLISFFLFLPVLIGSIILIIKLRDFFSHAKRVEEEEEEGEGGDYDTERSQEAHQPETARTVCTVDHNARTAAQQPIYILTHHYNKPYNSHSFQNTKWKWTAFKLIHNHLDNSFQ